MGELAMLYLHNACKAYNHNALELIRTRYARGRLSKRQHQEMDC